MSELNPVFRPVIHHRPEELKQARLHFRVNLEFRGELIKFSCKLLAYHEVRRADAVAYDHPEPGFSRVFLFHGVGADYEDETQRREMRPGLVYFLPAGRRFKMRYRPGTRQIAMHLHLTDAVGRGVFSAHDPLLEFDRPELSATLQNAVAAGNPLAGISAAMAVSEAALEGKLDELAERAVHIRHFTPLFAALSSMPPAQINIQELAEKLSLGADTLSHQFRRRMGCSLKSYLNELLVQRAQEELLHSSSTVEEIAGRLGFRNEKYFHCFFKRHCGESPGRYRKSHSPLS